MTMHDVYVKFEVFAIDQEDAAGLVQPYLDSLRLRGVSIVNDEKWVLLHGGNSLVETSLARAVHDAWTLFEFDRQSEANRKIMEGMRELDEPIDMVLHCPSCGKQHIDAPEPCNNEACEATCCQPGECMAWMNPPHRSHKCHSCGHIWRPADVPTKGVASLKTAGKNDTTLYRHDWAAIAMKLKEGLSAAINYGKFRGIMINMTSGESSGIYGYMADRLESYPGITVDRELLGLTSRQIAKVKREREKNAAKEPT